MGDDADIISGCDNRGFFGFYELLGATEMKITFLTWCELTAVPIALSHFRKAHLESFLKGLASLLKQLRRQKEIDTMSDTTPVGTQVVVNYDVKVKFRAFDTDFGTTTLSSGMMVLPFPADIAAPLAAWIQAQPKAPGFTEDIRGLMFDATLGVK